MKRFSYPSRSSRETASLAKLLAKEIFKTRPAKKALVIGLIGELGAGKTVFIKALMRTLGVKAKITSPTFVLFRRFRLPQSKSYKNIFHFDAYRIKSSKELAKLGLTRTFNHPQNLVVIEWADKVRRLLPQGTIWIKLKHGRHPNERHITFNRR